MTSKPHLPLRVMQSEPAAAADFVLEADGLNAMVVPPQTMEVRERVVQALRTVRDPELPVNVYDLGLIYDLEIDDAGGVRLEMTLTAPACPVAGEVVSEVHQKVRSVPGVSHVRTALVWDPPWTTERLSAAARLELGLM